MSSPILTYHSIDSTGSPISVAEDQFAEQMALLHRRGYRAITLGEMVESMRSGSRDSRKTVILTFDDALSSFYEVARPILSRYGFRAAVFVPTHHVGQRCGWEDQLPISDFTVMTWAQLEELHAAGFDVQPHSCTHPHLTQLNAEEAQREVIDSKLVIEDRLSKRCDFFCYPFGDFNDETISIVERAEFRGAISTRFGRSNRVDDLFQLRRLGSAHFASSRLRFQASLFGVYERAWRIKRWVSPR